MRATFRFSGVASWKLVVLYFIDEPPPRTCILLLRHNQEVSCDCKTGFRDLEGNPEKVWQAGGECNTKNWRLGFLRKNIFAIMLGIILIPII